MNKPLQIGITGGIASGKSLVCHVFRLLGIPTYEADTRAKILMNSDPELIEAIKQHFGDKSYDAEGMLDRSYLASQVFNQGSKIEILNGLVHPRMGEDFEEWTQERTNQPYVLNEAALIFESGRFKTLDKVITVFAPLALRVARVKKRDPHRSEEEIRAIMAKQMSEEEKKDLADYILYNDEEQLLIPQITQLHQRMVDLRHSEKPSSPKEAE